MGHHSPLFVTTGWRFSRPKADLRFSSSIFPSDFCTGIPTCSVAAPPGRVGCDGVGWVCAYVRGGDVKQSPL